MASRFTGRDYSTLREEIIDFLRSRLSSDWDWTNLSDPVVIFAESLARIGDQLHYTIDELRRECDMATAKRGSSIYSYAMREGYKMFLPKCSSGTLLVNSKEQSDRIQIGIHKFDEINVTTTGNTLVAADDVGGILYSPVNSDYAESLKDNINDYASYVNNISSRTIRLPVVLGKKETFKFTYNDINTDSTVDLPDPIIDRDVISLKVDNQELRYVEDIIGSGFYEDTYTLTPKFIGGAISLCIEFPTNYRNISLFKPSSTFEFTYVKAQDSKIDVPTNGDVIEIDLNPYITPAEGYEDDEDILAGYKYEVDLNGGIKGYTEFENPNTTRENYKKFVQNYAALLTKDDYDSYIKASTSQHCQIFDHSDNYKTDVLPSGTSLIPRVVYIVTDADYSARKSLWEDLIERSSRSDCIVLMPYGKDPYTIFVKAECYLLGTSVSSIATQIKSALLQYYGGDINGKVPEPSMINYLVHKSSDKVIRMESCVMQDTTFGTTDKTFNNVNLLSGDDIDNLYNAILQGNTNFNIDGTYYLRGDFTQDGHVYYYNKYQIHTYNAFPERFPDIYLVSSGDVISDYNDLVRHQVVYGELDTSVWDVKDDSIFINTRTNDDAERVIDPEYIKHHYMTPVLNNVVVMIKAIS